MKSLEVALEMFYLDNGRYPNMYAYTCCGGTVANSSFQAALALYITIDLTDPLFGLGISGGSLFYYQSSSGNNHQTYGMAMNLLDPGNTYLKLNDGGAWSLYEIGPEVRYCKDKYGSGNAGFWINGPGGAVCRGGN
jgi:hypothetical protein